MKSQVLSLRFVSTLLVAGILFTSCDDQFIEEDPAPIIPLPESTTTVPGKQVLKVIPHPGGWISLNETIQPQYLVTAPIREIAWLSEDFSRYSGYTAPEEWSLIDAVVHPSGQVTAAIINMSVKRAEFIRIKLIRFKSDGSQLETELFPLPKEGERIKYFPASLDRIRLNAVGEDVYVVARWQYNEVEASRVSFAGGLFHTDWQMVVEPDSFCGIYGIIGGGYDNFRQGDRYFFVYSGVDSQGQLYVAVNSHEELLLSHDQMFGENLMAGADPSTYDFGVAILTKISPQGNRIWSKLEGKSRQKRFLDLSVSDDAVYLSGRVKISTEGNGWDAWVLAVEASNGSVRYESQVDIKEGDMFWDVEPLAGGQLLAVGTTNYYQNPAGLSVTDARTAAAVILDHSGKLIKSLEVPQGPAQRGSETMFLKILNGNSVLFAGAHNAPGTHAEVYSDGFIAVRNLDTGGL